MDFKKSSDYKSGIDYENILAGHLANMAIYRDKNPRMYASSIETLILMCPMEIREKAQKRMQELKWGVVTILTLPQKQFVYMMNYGNTLVCYWNGKT